MFEIGLTLFFGALILFFGVLVGSSLVIASQKNVLGVRRTDHTVFKALTAMERAGMTPEQSTELMTLMQNSGLEFVEKVT